MLCVSKWYCIIKVFNYNKFWDRGLMNKLTYTNPQSMVYRTWSYENPNYSDIKSWGWDTQLVQQQNNNSTKAHSADIIVEIIT